MLSSSRVPVHSSLFRSSRQRLTCCLSSAASAYSPLPWIQTLTQYVRDLASSHPRVKIVGICFGHQIVAQALGGQVVPNNGLWEIGVSQVRLTKAGVDVFGEGDEELIVGKHCGSLDGTHTKHSRAVEYPTNAQRSCSQSPSKLHAAWVIHSLPSPRNGASIRHEPKCTFRKDRSIKYPHSHCPGTPRVHRLDC